MRRFLCIALLCLSRAAFAGSYGDFARGLNANNRGDASSAIRYFTAALDAGDLAAPYLPAAHLGRARALLHQRRCRRARADLDRAIRMTSDYRDALALRETARHCQGANIAAADDDKTTVRPAAVYQIPLAARSRATGIHDRRVSSFCAEKESLVMEPDWFGGMTVSAATGGRRITLLIDTGGSTSMLTDTTVSALGLTTKPLRDETVTLYGGLRLKKSAELSGVALGGGTQGPSVFYVAPADRLPYALSGTLAPDFLSRFDVEFDFANARLNLYAPGACPMPTANVLPVSTDANRHLVAEADLDGRKIPAMLDTGASRSDFSLETARTLYGAALNEMRPAGSRDAETGLYTYPFKKVSLDGVGVVAPEVLVVPDAISRRPAGTPRLILGLNVLRHLHLFISYSRQRLAVEPAQ